MRRQHVQSVLFPAVLASSTVFSLLTLPFFFYQSQTGMTNDSSLLDRRLQSILTSHNRDLTIRYIGGSMVLSVATGIAVVELQRRRFQHLRQSIEQKAQTKLLAQEMLLQKAVLINSQQSFDLQQPSDSQQPLSSVKEVQLSASLNANNHWTANDFSLDLLTPPAVLADDSTNSSSIDSENHVTVDLADDSDNNSLSGFTKESVINSVELPEQLSIAAEFSDSNFLDAEPDIQTNLIQTNLVQANPTDSQVDSQVDSIDRSLDGSKYGSITELTGEYQTCWIWVNQRRRRLVAVQIAEKYYGFFRLLPTQTEAMETAQQLSCRQHQTLITPVEQQYAVWVWEPEAELELTSVSADV